MEAKQISILIAEDESIIALDIKKILSNYGYNVTAVIHKGEDILPALIKGKCDLILMDIHLNGKKSGIEAAEEVKSSYNIPIIYLTAITDAETTAKAKKTSPYEFVLKPFDAESLHSAIQKAVKKKINDKPGKIVFLS